MTEPSGFESLIQRVRAGDAVAAEELVRTYEADLRIVARSRLRDSRMRRTLDSLDICQSVLGNFFVRAANGQFDIETPEDLLKLLATMARNKVTDHARYGAAGKRDNNQLATTPADEMAIGASTESPSQVVAARELFEKVDNALPEEIREIAKQRRDGMGWNEIADQVGENAEAVRKRFTRCMNRVCGELGIDEPE